MCAATVQTVRRPGVLVGGLAFTLQVLIAISIEVGDDVGRALFSQHGTTEGIHHARDLVAFEVGHGFFVEPAWQTFFLQTRHIAIVSVSWVDVARLFNGVYVFGHVFFTLGVALWVYIYRRRWFGVLRNLVLLANLFALLVYENFPVAPPRLTTGIIFDHHAFTFRDTLFGVVNASGQVVGTQTGYNEFSAMPSVHMAWAVVAGAALIVLARPLWAKAIGAIYPLCMLLAVVVTGNHYLLDVAGGIADAALAFGAAILLDRWWNNPNRQVLRFRGLSRSSP
jgi:membrane-associated phospholipid phosphatase